MDGLEAGATSRRTNDSPMIGFRTGSHSFSSSGYTAFQSSSTIAPLPVLRLRWRKQDHQLTSPLTSGQIVWRANVLLRVYS